MPTASYLTLPPSDTLDALVLGEERWFYQCVFCSFLSRALLDWLSCTSPTETCQSEKKVRYTSDILLHNLALELVSHFFQTVK